MSKGNKTFRKFDTIETTAENPFLKQYNLQIGDSVQFRKKEGTSWAVGHVTGDNSDGSITLVVAGKMRAIMPEYIQIQITGKRGAKIWVDLMPTNNN